MRTPPVPAEQRSRYHTRRGVAVDLGLDIRSVDRALARRELEHFKIGRRVLISDDQLETWLEKHRRKAA